MADVQFIAYQLQTAAEGDTARARYPGLSDQVRDIELRAKIMVDAIEAAKRSSTINAMATKIFVAPEFFFRGGVDGVYEIENFAKINETMDTYLAHDDYAKWIFVLGTALGVMPEQGGKHEIINAAIVRTGGKASAGGAGSRLVYKEYVSAIDFLGASFGDVDAFMDDAPTAGKANIKRAERKLMPTSGSRATGRVAHVDPPNLHGAAKTWKPSAKLRSALEKKFREGKLSEGDKKRLLKSVDYTTSEESKSGLGGGTNFTMGGIEFVLEVCLDHLQRRAAVTGATPDVHLVTSCGMEPKYGMMKDGGFFFLVDGITEDPTACSVWSGTRPRATTRSTAWTTSTWTSPCGGSGTPRAGRTSFKPAAARSTCSRRSPCRDQRS